MKSAAKVENLVFSNMVQYSTVNIHTIRTSLIALFAVAIYNIYDLYSER